MKNKNFIGYGIPDPLPEYLVEIIAKNWCEAVDKEILDILLKKDKINLDS